MLISNPQMGGTHDMMTLERPILTQYLMFAIVSVSAIHHISLQLLMLLFCLDNLPFLGHAYSCPRHYAWRRTKAESNHDKWPYSFMVICIGWQRQSSYYSTNNPVSPLMEATFFSTPGLHRRLGLKVWYCLFGRFDPSTSNVHNLSMPLS